MSGPWQNVAAATIPQFMRGAIDATYRRYKWLALLQAKGKVTFNNGGSRVERVIKYRQAQLQQYEDGQGITFPKVARHKRAVQDWAAYVMPEFISRTDKLMNKGTEALVDLFSNKVETLMKEFTAQFHSQLYVDGNATGFEDAIDGVETFFGMSGASSAGFVGLPNSTYSGLSCALQAAGGSWSVNGSSVSTWPIGSGDPQYDYWSPMIVLYDDAAFSIPTTTWAARGEEVIRFALTHSMRNASTDGMTDVVMLAPELWRLYKNLTAGKERITVARGESDSLISLGFKDTMELDGAEITSEFGVKSNTGYGLNFDQMELQSMNPDLFNFVGPTYMPTDDGEMFFLAFNGQLITRTPRDHFKIRNTAGT